MAASISVEWLTSLVVTTGIVGMPALRPMPLSVLLLDLLARCAASS